MPLLVHKLVKLLSLIGVDVLGQLICEAPKRAQIGMVGKMPSG
jgi:hypothetical protein